MGILWVIYIIIDYISIYFFIDPTKDWKFDPLHCYHSSVKCLGTFSIICHDPNLGGNSTHYTIPKLSIQWLVVNSEDCCSKGRGRQLFMKVHSSLVHPGCGSGGFSVSVLNRNVTVPQWEYCEKSLIGNGGSRSCGFLSHTDSLDCLCWRTETLSHGGDLNEILYSPDERLLENI